MAGPWQSAFLWLFRLASIASASELLLLSHYENAWQQLPLWLLAIGVASSFLVTRGPRKVFSVICVLLVVGGLVGVLLHYQDNAGFEREMQPTLAGLPLVWAALRGAVPALAPGVLVFLGALGLLIVRGPFNR